MFINGSFRWSTSFVPVQTHLDPPCAIWGPVRTSSSLTCSICPSFCLVSIASRTFEHWLKCVCFMLKGNRVKFVLSKWSLILNSTFWFTSGNQIAALSQMSWLMKTAAIELRVTSLNRQRSHTQRLVSLLLDDQPHTQHTGILLPKLWPVGLNDWSKISFKNVNFRNLQVLWVCKINDHTQIISTLKNVISLLKSLMQPLLF